MTLLPKVKLKALPTFPSNIIGGTGLTSTKNNGAVTLDYAWQEFGAIDAIPTSPTSYILTYDTVAKTYVMVPSHLLGGAVSGISDAPNDGVLYGRQSTGWSPVAGSTPASNPPLMDGTAAVGGSIKYAREDHRHPTDTTRVSDAPSDGTLYARRNAAWTTVPPSGIADAPSDGTQYARQSAGWTAVAAGAPAAVAIYDTRTAAIAANILPGTTYIRINGYSAVTDGGGFDAFEVANSGTLTAWQFQSNAGSRRWQIANTMINPRMFGGVGNGTNDDTAALQACITMRAALGKVSIYIPPVIGAWRITAPLTVSSSMVLHGDGMPGTYVDIVSAPGVWARQPGSWVLFDHLGVGFYIANGADLSHVVFDGIGTMRNQPAPGASFTPIAANYDFYCIDADVMILNCMLLNPTYGVYFKSRGGRLTMTNVRGQPLKECVNIYMAFDCCRLTDIHWWIYWASTDVLNTYTANNRRSLRTATADGMLVMNYFTIYDLVGHDIYVTSPADSPAIGPGRNSLIRAKLVNCYFDGSATGVSVDPAAQGVIIEYLNLLIAYAKNVNPPNAQAFIVSCNNAEIYIVNFEVSFAGQSAIYLQGTGNRVAIHNPRIHGWGAFDNSTTAPALINLTGNFLKLTGEIYVNPAPGGTSAVIKGGSGAAAITGQLASGYGAYSAAAGGTVTIAHGSRTVPSHGIANCYGGVTGFFAITSLLNSVDATNAQFLFTNAAGAAATGTATFHWEVFI